MGARFGWLLSAAALACAPVACTQKPDTVARARAAVQAIGAGGSGGTQGVDGTGGNRGLMTTGIGSRGPNDAATQQPNVYAPDAAASQCPALVSTYEALQYVESHNCEIPPTDPFLGPLIAFAKQYPAPRTGETRMPTYCDLVPGSNPVYYMVPDSGITKLCPAYCDAGKSFLADPRVSKSYVDCKNGP